MSLCEYAKVVRVWIDKKWSSRSEHWGLGNFRGWGMGENEKMGWKGASNGINPGENNFQEDSIVIANTVFLFLLHTALKI